MNLGELWIHYYMHPLEPVKQLEPEHSSSTVLVLDYPKWLANKCKCCGKHGASGIWLCEFSTYTVHHLLCATCGLREAFAKWNGFFSPKLVKVDLIMTLTYQSNSAPLP